MSFNWEAKYPIIVLLAKAFDGPSGKSVDKASTDNLERPQLIMVWSPAYKC